MRHRAFTIVELLLVMVVLVVLASLMVPTFLEARERARQVSCMSNLAQLGKAFQIYRDDSDDRNPGAGDYSEASMGGWIWCQQEFVVVIKQGSLYRYVKSERVFHCPSAANSLLSRQGLSYSMNHELGWLVESLIFDSSATVLLLEEGDTSMLGLGPNDPVFYPSHKIDLLAERHHGGCNFSWADGHSSWRSATIRWDPQIFQPIR